MTNCTAVTVSATIHSIRTTTYSPGAAYLREMYDIYGSPGFLAAYNAGPRRLDDYLSNNRPLPDETRHYVAMIGPKIVGVYPSNRSPAEDYAMNALPIDIPPGHALRPRDPACQQSRWWWPCAGARSGPGGATAESRGQARSSAAAICVGAATAAAASAWPDSAIIQQAVAAEVPMHHGGAGGGQWAIQVGAYSNERQAHAALGTAREHAAASSRSPTRRCPVCTRGTRCCIARDDRTVARCGRAGVRTAVA